MVQQRAKGWLMLLSDSEDSEWGGIEEFYESVLANGGNRDVIELESEVWGKLNRSGLRPRPGDGIAFYHTSRAHFPKHDPFRRRPRISLLGELTEIEQDGQNIHFLKARIRRADLERLRESPIIRDDKTKHLFEQCGMVPGSVATFYEVPPDVWSEFLLRTNSAREASPKVSIPRLTDAKSWDDLADTEASDLAAIEGVAKEVTTYRKGRSRLLRNEALSRANGVCEVCGTDFSQLLGGRGTRVLEVHHRAQLSASDAPRLTRVTELAVVCSNCHALIHMNPKEAMSIEALKAML